MKKLRRRHPTLVVLLSIALVGSACAADDPVLEESPAGTAVMEPDHEDEMEQDMEEESEHAAFSFGEPAEPAAADRVIEIEALDIAFEPTTIDIAVGETVTFRVTNSGAIPHDFTLGTAAMQEEHEAEMAEMSGEMMHDEPNAFELAPGETKETTWHFTEAGELFIGCHQTGHYAAGMEIALTVSG